MLHATHDRDMIWIMSDVWQKIFSGAAERVRERGTAVFRRNDRPRWMYIVREGTVVLRRSLADGGALNLQQTREGELLAEASLFADRYHCDAVCETRVRLAFRPRQDVVAALAENRNAIAALADASREVQALRSRLEIIRLKTLRARLDAYLDLFGKPKRGEWVRVADWIGVTPEALYRELALRGKIAGV